tara:strand:+ start:1582 stop:2463 length:882 start_codon:yes stop_codon:yes gene_type:complete
MRYKYKNILKRHAKSFYFAGLLLDSQTLNDAAILYAFCRQLDDAADNFGLNNSNKLEKLIQDYRQQVSEDPVNQSFKKIQKKYGLKQKFIDDLIAGVSSDTSFKQPQNLQELLLYSYQVAGTVGALMSNILGADNKNAERFAIDLGIGMQLTNISRDVKEDSMNNRIYIPKDMLPDNFSLKDILNNQNKECIFNATDRLLEIAERYYQSGIDGIYYIPHKNRFSILIAAILYNSIGAKILKNKHLYLKKRIYLNTFEKTFILIKNYFIKNKIYKTTEPIHKTNELHTPYQLLS